MMQQKDMVIGRFYALEGGVKVELLATGIKKWSSRADHVRVRYLSGQLNQQERPIAGRNLHHEWGEADDLRAQKRGERITALNNLRIRVANTGLVEAVAQVQSNDVPVLTIRGDEVDDVLSILERVRGRA